MKKIVLSAAIAVLTGAGALLTHKANTNSTEGMSDLELANAEALARVETLNPPCNNLSGYRKWETSSVAPEPKEEFRDCCYEKKKGYHPTPCVD